MGQIRGPQQNKAPNRVDSAAPESLYRYRFDDLTLDTGQYRVWRGDGEISLAKLTFELLRVLVEAAPNVVTHAEIANKVWGSGRVVTPETLAKRVMLLRRALGDQAEHPRYIEGVRQQGYRLVPAVTKVRTAAADVAQTNDPRRSGRRRSDRWRKQWLSIAASIGVIAIALLAGARWIAPRTADVVPSARDSIAVLPFENEGQFPADAYLSGFSDELRDQLGRAGLRVAARSSSVAAGNTANAPTEAAVQLGVGTILEGRLGRRADRLFASVELSEGQTGLSLWSRTFDLAPEDLPAIQQEITEQIVQRILPDANNTVTRTATANASANELLLLGRYYEQQVRDKPEVDEGLLLEAIELYRQASEADPQSALAHSRLAGALIYLGDVADAEDPISRARALDPELADVQVTLGEYLWRRRQPGAGAAWERAIELNEYDADALGHYAYWRWQQGFSDGPASFYRRALAVDPMNLNRYVDLGNFFGNEGRVAELIDIVQEIQERFDSAAAHSAVSDLLAMTGEVDQGIAWAIKARDLDPSNPAYTWQLASLYAQIGDYETALQLEPEPSIGLLYWMRRYEALIELGESIMAEQPNDLHVRYLLGFAYNATEQYAAAIWVLRSTGLPGTSLGEKFQAIDREALLTLTGALQGAGDTDGANELADYWVTARHVENSDWWIQAHTACAWATLDKSAEAFQALELIASSARLPSYPFLKDSVCFQKYQNDPRYEALLDGIETRWRSLRERLPTTLASHGVAL